VGDHDLGMAPSEADIQLRGASPSSEAEIHPRVCFTLERGGNVPEGAPSPRARRKCARGGA
jgi:hypothetical protein